MDDYEFLCVDLELHLQALKTLTEIEGEEEDFSLESASRVFAREPYVTARFEDSIGGDFQASISDAINYTIDSLYLVHHRNANIQDLADLLEELDSSAARFVRISAWSFLAAWNLRYGGLYEQIVEKGVVKPRLYGPER